MTELHENLDKPIGREIGWERLDTQYPYVYRRFRIRQDRVRLPRGSELEFAYTESRGAVFIVPVTDDGNVVLIRQYRYSPDEWCWEVPAGSLFDHQGTLEESARRELIEEIGASFEELVYVTWFYGSVSASDTVCHVMLARGTRLDRTPQREETEFIEIHPTPAEKALSMARGGEMRDGRSALTLLLSEPLLKDYLGE
jgi:ADP-ribose pyrophosphatase